jgi:hypothetical protein
MMLGVPSRSRWPQGKRAMRPRAATCYVFYRTYALDIASSWTALMKAMKHDSSCWIWALSRWSHRIRCGQSRGRSRRPGTRRRNEIERLFRRLKGFRRIFSRADKLAVMFMAFLCFALVIEALRSC